ncbi:MAG TPA: hypothetical protein VIG30_19465 [Ktedonobacterales bacterium]|jgi:hypothetical protein
MSERFARDDDDQGTEDFEHGWEALRGLKGRTSARLERIKRRREYAPISPWEVVVVAPCPFCADGGLRMAGYVTRARRLLAVRQCDTCGAVQIGNIFYPGALDTRELRGPDDDHDNDRDDDRDDDDDGDEDGHDRRRLG